MVVRLGRVFSWLVALEDGRRELDCGERLGKMREKKWLAGEQPKKIGRGV